jgi:hypothetical protein
MTYPTLAEVETASQHQLGSWLRFLKSPGMSIITSGTDYTSDELDERLFNESTVLARIGERFNGWTPELSKAIGW